MIANNNRRIGLLIFHITCGIFYLVCIPLSIYGYYAFSTSLSVYNVLSASYSVDYTWLIVSIILDFLVCTLSIVECAISCCNCCGWYQTPQATQAPVVMMYPPTNYTTAPSASVYPAANAQDSSKRDWLPNRENTEGKMRK